MRVRFILPVTLLLLSCHIASANVPRLNKLQGEWITVDAGPSHKTTQVCEFFENTQRTCIIEEASFSTKFGEAHINKVTGTWHLDGEALTVTETLNFSSVAHQFQFKVKSITASQLVLVSEHGDTTTWHRANY
ncbi:hypothetical protein [Pseudoalteromonas rubra]|uniref:hypothetical protein n=1 Tax=Pseudoalteromonas rubra TaxID=43658 RepID=UPI0003962F73|nr:hypothetical protein [Pseudoalteromonas rubra]